MLSIFLKCSLLCLLDTSLAKLNTIVLIISLYVYKLDGHVGTSRGMLKANCTVFPDPDSGCSVFSGGCFTAQTALFGSDLLIVNMCVKSKVFSKKQMMICFEGQTLHFLFC